MFGEELDEFLRQRLRELGRVDQYPLFTRRWVVDEPGFLELEPCFRVEVVEFVFHGFAVPAVTGVRDGSSVGGGGM